MVGDGAALRNIRLGLLGLLVIFGAACVGDSERAAVDETTTTVHKPTIRFAGTNWTAAELNNQIARQLVESHLRYPTEVVAVDETHSMMLDIANSRLDVVLEVWPSTLPPASAELVESGRVVELGPLGVTGKIGWFVPSYVVADNAELASWEAYKDSANASLFATDETAPQGRFLGTDYNFQENDEQLIESLGLPFVYELSGSEEATFEIVEDAVAAGEPILLYWWTPTSLVERFDLVNVSLPERTPECLTAAETEPIRCDYPEDTLVKLAAPGLETKAPEVHSFLRAFEISTEDQAAMIAQVEIDGMSIEEVAAEWIDQNEPIWTQWLLVDE